MVVKRGYKQTEVGVIPEDWEIKSANQISTPVRGGSPRPAGDPRYFNGSHIPWLTVAALTNIPASQLVVSETATFLTEEGSLYSRTLPAGTLIIANSGATLGVAKILGIKCCANDGIAALLNLSRSVSARYLAHFINARTNYLRDIVATGNGQPNLNTTLIGNFKFPLPPTKAEQEAVAEALSDADAAIESLEQLAAKKRQIKQGAVQELLGRKKRLLGSYKEWEVVNLDSVAERIAGVWGANDPSPDHSRCIDIIRAGDISQDGLLTGSAQRFLSESEFSKAHCRLDDVVITTSGNGLGKVWWCDGRPNVAASNFVRILRPLHGKSQGRYLSYILRSEAGLKQLEAHTATSAYPNLRPSFFGEPWILLPPFSEQEAIAGVLSQMDAEIAALEAKLAKARQIKQGMMQELLTGRIRLV